ncbi:hypothetical protein LCGC14_2538780 [marine sediment metagenome]|uniref:Uncharacterized protein n=1 Tax=marine sediment metagenome TaxID=412755 RepID=A0A0F9ARR2_9ZZZZ
MGSKLETTPEDVAHLLENFDDYVNPAGDEDPWFTLAEINQQFAWEDIPEGTLADWIAELIRAGQVEQRANEVRWLS